MMYALQKFKHFLLEQHFKMFIDHSALRYPVNKPVLRGRICTWFLLFQEFAFEVVVKLGILDAWPDHLSRITNERNQEAWTTIFLMHNSFQCILMMNTFLISLNFLVQDFPQWNTTLRIRRIWWVELHITNLLHDTCII